MKVILFTVARARVRVWSFVGEGMCARACIYARALVGAACVCVSADARPHFYILKWKRGVISSEEKTREGIRR